MSNYQNTQDLLNGALNRVGELTDGTSPYLSQALTYLNGLYLSIYAGGNEFDIELGVDWEWAKNPNSGSLILNPAISTGTLSVVNGSSTITFSSAPTVSVTGYYLKIDNRPDWYRINSHTANVVTATIDVAYNDTTASSLTFKVIPLDYQLQSGIMRLIGPMNIYRIQDDRGDDEGKIYQVKYNKFMKENPFHNMFETIPTQFTEMSRTNDGTITVRMNNWPTYAAKVDYDFIPIPSPLTNSTISIPNMPVEFRVVLEYGTAYFLMVDKNDDRAPQYFQLTKQKLDAMVNAYRKEKNYTAKDRGRIIPRQDLYTRTRRLVRQENS